MLKLYLLLAIVNAAKVNKYGILNEYFLNHNIGHQNRKPIKSVGYQKDNP